MQHQVYNKGRIPAAILSFLLIGFVAACIMYLITDFVLMTRDTIPSRHRRGYDISFSTILILCYSLLFVGGILYATIQYLFPAVSKKYSFKIVIGAIAGLLPVVMLHLSTFGLSLTDPATLTELLIMVLAGAMIPVVNKKLMGILE
ncbi:MAG: hypothetical protein ABL870_12875 [Sediminibacterium sp.]